jgi:hypothetical protein
MTSEPVMKRATGLAGVFVMLVLGLAFAGAPLAQTTTSVNVHKFEVIAVDGNRLVARDERGTNEYTVPDDFRFTVNGKKMSVSELKPGMKGTATVTTTTTVKPVFVTELRGGLVVKVAEGSVTVLDKTDGKRKRFTQGQLNDRGLEIFKDGRLVTISQLNKGDEITATIVSQGPPELVTETEVDATLAQAQPSPASAPTPTESTPTPTVSTPTPTEATPASTPMPAVAAQPAAPVETPPSAAAPSAPAPVESSGLGMAWYVLIVVVIAGVLLFFVRRRKDENPPR